MQRFDIELVARSARALDFDFDEHECVRFNGCGEEDKG